MKFTRTNKGFTLIELLVVIAIIGILSSVVLASLNTARSKGNDAKVKAQLSGLRAAAEIYFDNEGSYAGICTVDTDTDEAGLTPYLTASNYPGTPTITCNLNAGNTAYAVSVPLTTSGQHWCVDSSGKSKQQSVVAAAGLCQ